MSKKNIKEEKIIKETKYCKMMNQGKFGEDEYTYSIEKIYIKELKRNEVRYRVLITINVVIKAFIIFRRKRVMKRILYVGVIRKGKIIIKTCDEKEIRRSV